MNTFLTPSSIAAELRPDLDPEDACEIYTGTDPLNQLLKAYFHGGRSCQQL